MIKKNRLAFFLFIITWGMGLGAQETPEVRLPLKQVVLYSSGVGYFRHSSAVSGAARTALSFNYSAVNDALKSLVINDPASASPWVSYASEQTLARTLASLKVNLLGNPGIASILNSLRGAEIQVQAPNLIAGRILGVEYRSGSSSPPGSRAGTTDAAAFLSLLTPQGIRVLALEEISSFSFPDPAINADFNRALDLILASREADARDLTVFLPGQGRRDVSLSYVIPSPIWKVSYRLDLDQSRPVIQGWAIVDNDSDTDWEAVELSLVTGRPVSFIQNLYPPYYLQRPTLPLAIAGIAQARTYEPGWQGAHSNQAFSIVDEYYYEESADLEMMKLQDYSMSKTAPRAAPSVSTGVVETARGGAAGDQFSFTVKTPITLPRQQSAMYPLVEGPVKAEKLLIFSGAAASGGGSVNPALSVELTNNTGMKLPAGPITVFDGGTYAGDALVEFFPPGDKRLISYGDDLSVTGTVETDNSRELVRVGLSQGVMLISRKTVHTRTYAIRNASGEAKRLLIEHPLTRGASLAEPAAYYEKTDALYRFLLNLPAGGELRFGVKEETPSQERVVLSQLSQNTFLTYISSAEIPENVKNSLRQALGLKEKADLAKNTLSNLDQEKTRKISDQDRIRRNLEAAGSQTQQGLEYLRRLAAMDAEIDDLTEKILAARQAAQAAQAQYENFLTSLTLN